MSTIMTYNALGKNGRFGNQLFQIASTIGFAIRADLPYGFPDWEYNNVFKNYLPKISAGDKCHTLKGYLQDYRYFDFCADIIRKQFTLKLLRMPIYENTIFIHFRAYSNENVQHFHPEQDSTYYKKAISLFPDKNFVVFTDDIEKARKVVNIDCPYICGDPMVDFYLMSKCDGGIISNSTFSWWAAWLGGGEVTIPKKWFTSKAPYPDKGYYLKEWIVV